MKHVSQRLCVHETMLDRDVQEGFERRPSRRLILRELNSCKRRIELPADSIFVLNDSRDRRPFFRRVRGQAAADRVDPKGEKFVEPRRERIQSRGVFAEEVPIECFQMAQVKNDTMPFRNWTLIQRIRSYDLEERVGIFAGLEQTVSEEFYRGHGS